MAAQPTVKYYYKQDTNQILVEGANSKAAMNAMLTSSKDALNLQDILVSAKVKTIGQAVTYQSTAVYNTSSTEGFSIPIGEDQELWVYRGIQPANQSPIGTPPDAGQGDSNNTQYNAYLHRPYKLYLLTSTGSGIPVQPWLPFGRFFNEGTDNNTGNDPANFTGTYDLKQIAIVGNLNSTVNPFLVSQSIASGSLTIFGGDRLVSPWVYTKYNSVSLPPAVGAQWSLYKENATGDFNQMDFSTATAAANPGSFKIAVNNATLNSATEAYVDITPTNNGDLLSLSQSLVAGKNPYILNLNDFNGNIQSYQVSDASASFGGTGYTLTIAHPTQSGNPESWVTNTNISMSIDGALLQGKFNQSQLGTVNTAPNSYNTINLSNGFYTYTSSNFDAASADGQGASGSSQFGLYCQYDNYVTYKATVDISNGNAMRVTYTGSNFTPKFKDIPHGQNATFTALAGTVSQSGVQAGPSSFLLEVINDSTTVSTVDPTAVFSSRITDAYVSFSSSITNSLDGLYIFNQLPTEDIQVTASMFVNAWTGSDPGAAKYGDTNVTYSISPDPPLYGAGEAGDKPTWQTCSINIYKGNFPNNIPTFGDTPLHTETFKNADIHVSGLAITTSFVIPSQSIAFKDCIRLSLDVTSSQFENVTSSLVVQEYYLEFRNNTSSIEGSGLVPTSIDNAFQGTQGFSNAIDCQPLLNNVVLDRTNNQIQLIEYTSDPYVPSNFQQILSGSAPKSTVPASNYVSLGWENSRYVGAETRAADVNSIVGAKNTFGNSPVIDYKRAYLAYCDQVLDPYPVLNRATQFNIKYLINDAGDALNPRVSDYAAFDVEGTWDEKGIGRVGVNQISGSSQYDALNGFQVTSKVAKEPVPILYSQISAVTASAFIPIAGNASHIAVVTSSYIEYGMTAIGSNFLGNLNNIDEVTYFNLAQGIADQSAAIMPQSPGTFNSLQFTITRSANFAVSQSNAGETDGVVEGPIITSSIANPYSPPADVAGDQYFGNPGEIFFTTDPIGSGSTPGNPNALSDQYQIRGTFQINSTFPSERKTFKYYKGAGKKSKYSGGNVGSFDLWFESTVSTDLSLGTDDQQWIKEKWDWVQNTPGELAPTVTFYYGSGGNYEGNFTVNLYELGDEFNWNPDHTNFFFQIDTDIFKQKVDNLNIVDRDKIMFCQFNFPYQSDTLLEANRRYRFGGRFGYRFEDENQGERHNLWNPTQTPAGGDAATGQDEIIGTSAVGGPFAQLKVYGNQEASNLVNNALNFPYWTNLTSSNATQGNFRYAFNISSGSGYPGTAIDPGAGFLITNRPSGSIVPFVNLPTGSTSGIGINTNTFAVIPFPSASSATGTQPSSVMGTGAFLQIQSNGSKITSVQEVSDNTRRYKPGDTLVVPSSVLEVNGFGSNITSDLTVTLGTSNIVGTDRGSSQLYISSTTQVSGVNASASFARVSASVASDIDAGNPSSVKIYLNRTNDPAVFISASISEIQPDTPGNNVDYWIVNISQSQQSPTLNSSKFIGTLFDSITVNFNTGSVEAGGLVDNAIEMVSPTGNENYGLGYYQGYLPYTASVNPFFPGGLEPQDTAWPLPNIPWDIQVNDEIRFENNESLTYQIINVVPPQQNFADTGRNRLRLELAGGPNFNGSIPPSTNINFFLIRRYRYSPNTIIVDYPFPYGPLPTKREFVPSTNVTTINEGNQVGADATGSVATASQSGSFVNFVKPLLKSDNTPAGILLPEYPVEKLQTEPDEVIRDLRDKKLIE